MFLRVSATGSRYLFNSVHQEDPIIEKSKTYIHLSKLEVILTRLLPSTTDQVKKI